MAVYEMSILGWGWQQYVSTPIYVRQLFMLVESVRAEARLDEAERERMRQEARRRR